jgi:hypothetical protein
VYVGLGSVIPANSLESVIPPPSVACAARP